MNNEKKHGKSSDGFGPIQWLSNSLRTSIEETVSEYKGRAWRIRYGKDLKDLACHDCAIISDESFDVFFKYSEAADAKRQFEIELSDLQTLSKKAGVLIPRPIDIVRVENGWLLIMEALKTIQRENRQWKQIGTTLACIHRVKGDSCGFEMNGFCGPLIQDNTPVQNWANF